jgi:hypothetical protein
MLQTKSRVTKAVGERGFRIVDVPLIRRVESQSLLADKITIQKRL